MQKRLFQIATLIATFAIIPSTAQAAVLNTVANTPGHYVSSSEAMRAWLTKVPGAFSGIRTNPDDIRITNIDLQWKQTNLTRTKYVQRTRWSKRKAINTTTSTCTIHVTVEYQEYGRGEDMPTRVTRPAPYTVNSPCETYLAKNKLGSSFTGDSES